jgi:4-hydroxy-tetrahydrodipicolinate synthase
LHQALFLEPNPAGPKYALALLGKITEEVRSPMLKATEKAHGPIRAALVHAGLLVDA